MNAPLRTHSQDTPLYNIRIIRSYMDYLRKFYPRVNIERILAYAGISKFQYNEDGYWCNQQQINRMQEILLAETGNRNISRDAGRNLVNSHNMIALYVLGFLNPVNISRQLARVYRTLSRAATLQMKYLGNRQYEVLITPAPGVNEERFQCQNRIGSMEGLLGFFLHEYPQIDHPECYHKGARHCRYLISWSKSSKILNWIKSRNIAFGSGIFLSVIIYAIYPFIYALLTASITLFAGMYLTQHALRLEKDRMQKDLSEVSRAAEDYWNELNIRYSSNKLVQEVGEITSALLNEKEISAAVTGVMSKQLAYERGAILLADSDETLSFAGGYGFSKEEISVLNHAHCLTDDSDDNKIFLKVFKLQKPVLLEKANDDNHTLKTPESSKAGKLNMTSLLCVPIVHAGLSFGVMIVDSLESQRAFREGDINLLMAVASQTALSIANARSYRKLQEGENKYRTLVETIRDIVYTVDLQGRFTYISPMVKSLTGYTTDELQGLEFVKIVNPQHKVLILQRFADGIKSKEIYTSKIEIITKDNRIIPFEVNTAPLADSKGRSIGRIGVARDISRRYEAEAKRKEMELKALTQNKLASLGEIATGIAHEINQPLSYIKVILESTLSDMDTGNLDMAELSEDFNESLRQVGKISSIVAHLRTFGRSDATSLEPVSLSKVLDNMLILMKERLRLRNISIDIRIDENIPLLHGNHIKLEQVFINLIQNSIDAMEKQGQGSIILTAMAENDFVLVVYSDTGEGIDPKLQEKIFEPFFTTKEAGKGTGIGLSIVSGMIQEHKGSIICESQKGKGATFKITLPMYLKSTDSETTYLDA